MSIAKKNDAPPCSKRTAWIVGATAVSFILLITVLGLLFWNGNNDKRDFPVPQTPEELRGSLKTEQLETMSPEKRAQYMNQLARSLNSLPGEERRELFRDTDLRKQLEGLKPEDRDAFRKGMFAARREHRDDESGRGRQRDHRHRMHERIEEFFSASDAKQKAMLDERIDRMLERRKRWEERRRERADDRPRGSRRPRPSDDQLDDMLRGMLDHTDPKERTQIQEYFRRLRNRAQERGVELRGRRHR
ncbi:MAG: hypothetical protein ACLFWL_11010 [Candidatus Brocadiia bacterium]